MSKKKGKKKKTIGKKEFLFTFISIILLITLAIYYGARSLYYYSRQSNTQQSSRLADKIISNNKITTEKDGFHQENDGYIFKGNVTNNYVKFSNRLYRIIKVYNDNSIKIVSESNDSIIIWGDDITYSKSNLYSWLNKTVDNTGIYYDTIPNISLLKKTKYKENKLLNSKIKESKTEYNDYVSTLTINDYINVGGKNSYLKNGKYFWLIGYDKDNSNLYVDETGSIETATNYEAYGLRAVITLKKNIKMTTGLGLVDDPYIIDQEGNDNFIDKYVKLGNDVWKIYSDVNNILKLSLNGYITINNAEYESIYSKTTSEFNPNNKYNIAYYLNKTYYNSLPYKSVLLDNIYPTGEISNDTGLNMLNIYTDTTTSKVGMPSIFDYNTNSNLNDYFLSNTTSTTVGSMVYVYNNLGLLNEDKVTEKKHIVPTISINKQILKSGEGTLESPYVVE